MKRLLSILFLINLLLGNAQAKKEIYICFDKEYPGNVTKDTSQLGKITYYIEQTFSNDYLSLVINMDNLKVEKKSFLKKKNVLKISKLLSLDWPIDLKFFENKKLYIIESDKLDKKKVIIRALEIKAGFHEM